MPNNINQQPNISADHSAAALSFATMLSEQLMPKQEISEEIPQESAPLEEETPEESEIEEKPEMEKRVSDMEKKMDMEDYMADMETRMDEKIDKMKGEILEAIKSEK